MALKRIDKGIGSQLTDPCFCKDSSGEICWTNGLEYIQDGTAPRRVEVYRSVSYHGIIMSFEFAENLDVASDEEVQSFMEKIDEHFKRALFFETSRHQKAMNHLNERFQTWKARVPVVVV